MDNITHTMVGAALGQAGLRRYTGLGMATLMISANLPDVDVLAFLWTDPLAFRRGWTHGPVGLLVLPLLLTGAIVGWDRLQSRRGRRPAGHMPVRVLPILALAYVGILTHPFLDWLNTYGIRFLMPFSHEWFYGDALFIIDPWVWLALGLGLFYTGRRRKRSHASPTRPALGALVFVTLYITLMAGGSHVAHDAATREIEAQGRGPVENLMAGPVPINSLEREIIYDRGREYGFGTITLLPRLEVTLIPETLPKQDDHPLAIEAMRSDTIQAFLYWSRFPFFDIEEEGAGYRVSVSDARFARGTRRGWASRSVVVER
jgi:inner membrane protein